MPRSARDLLSWHRPLTLLSGALAMTALVLGVGYVADDRVLVGVPIWAKPLQFSISFALYALTLGWLVSRLRGRRTRRFARRAATTIAVAIALEMTAIVVQVVRGRHSHFNFSTPFDSAVFAAMGAFVVIIFVATVAAAIAFLVESPLTERATAWAVRLGLVITIAGMSVGFLMVRPTPGQGPSSPIRGAHSVGVDDGGPALPLLGWSTTGGDLRVAHFLGLHAIQALPLLALVLLVLPATARLGGQTRVRLVAVLGTGYAAVVALTLVQALRGQPLTHPDRWTTAAALTIVVLAAATTLAVLRADTPAAPGAVPVPAGPVTSPTP